MYVHQSNNTLTYSNKYYNSCEYLKFSNFMNMDRIFQNFDISRRHTRNFIEFKIQNIVSGRLVIIFDHIHVYLFYQFYLSECYKYNIKFISHNSFKSSHSFRFIYLTIIEKSTEKENCKKYLSYFSL